MKPILLTAVFLLNYLVDDIKISFSESKVLNRIVVTTSVTGDQQVVLIDFGKKRLIVDQKVNTSQLNKAESGITDKQSIQKIVTDNWMLAGVIL